MLRPAFYRQLGESYGVVAHAIVRPRATTTRPPPTAAAASTRSPTTRSSGASAPTNPSSRCSTSSSRAGSSSTTTATAPATRASPACASTACASAAARQAEVFGQRRFGGLVPSCRRCARRPVEPAAVSDVARRAGHLHHRRSRARVAVTRLEFVLAQLAAPVLILLVTADRRAGHRVRHPARVRSARHRRVAGHGAVAARRGSASGSASAAPKPCACNTVGVRSSPPSRSVATSCSPSS